MSQLDLLVLGDLNPDVIVSGAPGQVRYGQAEALVDAGALVIGGSAGITACGAARLGLSVGVCSVVGDDTLARYLVDRLAEAGVDLRHVRTDPSTPTGISVILDRGGDRAILTALGTIPALSPADLGQLPDRPARHVHIASCFLMSPEYRSALPPALSRFRAAGVTTSLDPNWDPSGGWDLAELLPGIDVFLPNAVELVAVTGVADAWQASAAVAAHGCDVVVKLGADGAQALVGGHELVVTTQQPLVFGDAVGAGDSFDAGFLTGRLTGRSDQEALRLASAVGTLSTRGVGGTAAQPDLAEALEWAAGLGVHDVAPAGEQR